MFVLYSNMHEACILNACTCKTCPSMARLLVILKYNIVLKFFGIPFTCRVLFSTLIGSMSQTMQAHTKERQTSSSPSINIAYTCSPPNMRGNNTWVENSTPFIHVPQHNYVYIVWKCITNKHKRSRALVN